VGPSYGLPGQPPGNPKRGPYCTPIWGPGSTPIYSQGAEDVAAIGRSEDGCIKVGIFSSLASGFLSDLPGLRQAHARVRIEFIDGDPADHVAAIRQFRLDVAFITGTSSGLTARSTNYGRNGYLSSSHAIIPIAVSGNSTGMTWRANGSL
jgi:hypothetical protein